MSEALRSRLLSAQVQKAFAGESATGQSWTPLDKAPKMEYVLYLSSLDLRHAEHQLIEHALFLVGNNKTKAARLLGLNVRSLRRKLNSKRKTEPSDPAQMALV